MSITVPLEGFGGGSNPLNFKIVGGQVQPKNPRENTIWVNTDVPITGWIFSATEPKAPAEGMVWISTGTSSAVEFNALKKNSIQVYPLSAKQWVNGAFVKVDASVYRDGAWNDWVRYLYDTGNQFADVTGGWEVKYEGDAPNEKYVTFESDYIEYVDRNISVTYVETKNKIDLTGKPKLKCSVTCTNMYDSRYVGFALYVGTSKNSLDAYVNITPANGESYEIVCDKISNFETPVYVGIKLTGAYAARIRKIWAE